MKRISFAWALVALFVFGTVSSSAATWKADKVHSQIAFEVSHLVISSTDGKFNDYDVTVIANKEDFSDAKIEVNIKTASVDTDNEKRDGHLRSDDFFAAEQHPDMKFVGKSMKSNGKNKYKLTGDLTIRGITKEVVLDVEYKGTTTAWGTTKAGFEITGEINRFDFGLKFDKTLETGGLVVGETVEIEIDLELDKQA